MLRIIWTEHIKQLCICQNPKLWLPMVTINYLPSLSSNWCNKEISEHLTEAKLHIRTTADSCGQFHLFKWQSISVHLMEISYDCFHVLKWRNGPSIKSYHANTKAHSTTNVHQPIVWRQPLLTSWSAYNLGHNLPV